jgi:hypothetical protein
VAKRIEVDERRARLGARHHLVKPAKTAGDAAAALIGLHSSDPVTVFLSCWARVRGFAPADLEHSLYEQRSLVRMLGMRRTMFVVPVTDAPLLDAACTKALAPAERRRLISLVEAQGVANDGGAWLHDVERRTLAALRQRGEATAAQLTKAVPELAGKLAFGEGKSWGGTMGLSTRVLFLLASEGRVVRGRPLGSWVSSQYRWAPTDRWLGAALDERNPPAARAELVQRWLRSYGPGTLTDLKWWTGWTNAATVAALRAAGAVEVRVDGGVAFDLDETRARPVRVSSWVALLPSLDPTVMGWKERAWYLGEHQPALFDRNGNAGPTVWFNGRVVGGWAQRPDGRVEVHLLERVDSTAGDAIAAEATRLSQWLGSTRVKPRFRTPLEKALADGELTT